MKITIETLSQIDRAAEQFVANMNGHHIFAFHGAMGAGKTTLISAICRQLGVKDTVSSPTFAIVNEYEASDGRTVSHFDFYRMNRPDEVMDMGADEYFYSNKICFIEWPDIADGLLPAETIDVYITVANDGSRTVEADMGEPQ